VPTQKSYAVKKLTAALQTEAFGRNFVELIGTVQWTNNECISPARRRFHYADVASRSHLLPLTQDGDAGSGGKAGVRRNAQRER
jgi:hypothetical protein